MKESIKPIVNKEKSSGTKLLEIQKELDKNGHPFGDGSRKLVFQHPDDNRKLIKKHLPYGGSYPQQLKKDFYLAKILNLLYPNNFPAIYTTLPSHKISVVEKVDKANIFSRFLLLKKKSKETQHVATNLGVELDTVDDNFILDKKNNAKYIDTPIGGDVEIIKKEIMEKLKDENQKEALKYLENYKKQFYSFYPSKD
jgi:hypothetical protein